MSREEEIHKLTDQMTHVINELKQQVYTQETVTNINLSFIITALLAIAQCLAIICDQMEGRSTE